MPNFSEGRRMEVIEQIAAAAASVPGTRVLDVHSDRDHNRSVLTLAGAPETVLEAVFQAASAATRLIDLRTHEGQHPRVGATDVVPFVPLADVTMEEVVDLARAFGARVAEELQIPVYFYEKAALVESRRNLEEVRRGGFEALERQIGADEGRAPDLGPRGVHETAGATIVGARRPLIAFNMYLGTKDLRLARAIAKTARNSSGGLRYVKALGLELTERGQVQVSMNLTDFTRTAMHTVFNLVKSEAEAHGVSVTESEIVGLVPLDALVDTGRHYLRLHGLDRRQVLEVRLMEAPES